MVTVGMPRALLYYEFFPLWQEFFANLGVQIITSQPTTKVTLDTGVVAAVDETCLPVKVFYGHFLELTGSCDYIFLPRLVSVEPNSYICPKFMGLPDLLRSLGYDKIIDPVVDLRCPRTFWAKLWEAVVATGRSVGVTSQTRLLQALIAGLSAQNRYRLQLYQGLLPSELLGGHPSTSSPAMSGRTIGVIGHPYTMFDDVINVNLFTFLHTHGHRVLTPAQYRSNLLNKVARSLPKDLFWTYGRRMIGAARLWYQQHMVDGIIHLVTFGCGTDSVTGEMIERLIHRESEIPFMLLTVDEHTGEAGFRTRLEAFLDMIDFKLQYLGGSALDDRQSNLSTYGNTKHRT